MSGDEATVAVIDCLGILRIPYLLVGSFSSNYYGIPRSTRDADFLIQLGDRSVRDRIDLPYLTLWCDRHGTREISEDIRRSLPSI